jgi:hypothetical protein
MRIQNRDSSRAVANPSGLLAADFHLLCFQLSQQLHSRQNYQAEKKNISSLFEQELLTN